MSTEIAAEMPACLLELSELSEDEEAELLADILTNGWDQGCFLSLGGGSPPPDLSPQRIEALLANLAHRPRPHPEGEIADPFEEEPLAQSLPEDDAAGLVVLSQRCDLIKPIAGEPLIEVASATCSEDAGLLAAARNGSSSQVVHLADVEPEAGWVADLRTAGHIPKHWLRDCRPSQLLPAGAHRRRFARRVGARRSRAAVPASLVEGVQRPLRGWLYKSAARNALCAHFSDLLLLPVGDGSWSLIAVPAPGRKLREAEDAFDQLFALIAERVSPFPLSEDHSDVVPMEQLTVAAYHDAFPLDLAHVTYGSRSEGGGHADPCL